MKPRMPHSKSTALRRRLFRAGGVTLIVLLAVGACVRFLLSWPLFPGPPLTQLVIPGPLAHVQPQAVRAAVLPALGKGFFSTKVQRVQAAVQTLPWVSSAAVRRSWPHTLYINITEEVPVARWNDTGLIDANGRLFVHSTDSAWNKLPMLSGPQGSEQDVLAEFNALTPVLTTRGLAIQQFSVDARGDSTLELNDGIKVRLGRADAELRLERFARVALPVLSEKLAAVAYVDMRYTNGFAVGWKPQTAGGMQHKEVGPNG